MIAIKYITHVDNGAPLTATDCVSSIAFDRFGIDGAQPAIQQLARSELLLSDLAFIDAGERAIHASFHDPSPDAVRSPTRQNLRPHTPTPTCAHTRTRHSRLSFPGAYRCEMAVLRSRRWHTPSHRHLLPSPPRATRLVRSLERSGCVGRSDPRTRPCESWPLARSLAARSALQQLPLLLPLRLRLPWLQARALSPSHEPLARRSARPYCRTQPAHRPGCGA